MASETDENSKESCGGDTVNKCRDGRGSQPMEPLQSWVCLVAAVAISIIFVIPDTTFSIFYDYLVIKFNADRAQVGWVFSIMKTTRSIAGKCKY